MPPKKTISADSTDTDGEKAPTVTDMKFFKAMMENMNGKPDIDWDSVATAMSLKDAKCAKERYRQIRLKFGWNEASSPASARKSAAAPATTTADPGTPTKATKVTKRRGKVGSKKPPVKKSLVENEDEGDVEAKSEDAGPAEAEDHLAGDAV